MEIVVLFSGSFKALFNPSPAFLADSVRFGLFGYGVVKEVVSVALHFRSFTSRPI
jgi:hypothetical protein